MAETDIPPAPFVIGMITPSGTGLSLPQTVTLANISFVNVNFQNFIVFQLLKLENIRKTGEGNWEKTYTLI